MTTEKNKTSSNETITPSINKNEEEELKILEHPSYKQLMEKLNEAEAKANDYWDAVLRAKAELENINRRSERDIANAHKYALEKFIDELLPIIDSLEQGLISCKELSNKNPDNNTLLSSICSGMQLTINMFLNVCKKFGIEQINPLNSPFNPDLHQAISTVEATDNNSNTVTQVLQKGYLLNSRLIRPALVVVAK